MMYLFEESVSQLKSPKSLVKYNTAKPDTVLDVKVKDLLSRLLTQVPVSWEGNVQALSITGKEETGVWDKRREVKVR